MSVTLEEYLAEEYLAGNDPCYECRGYGDDYYFDENGDLVSFCPMCWVTLREAGEHDGES